MAVDGNDADRVPVPHGVVGHAQETGGLLDGKILAYESHKDLSHGGKRRFLQISVTLPDRPWEGK